MEFEIITDGGRDARNLALKVEGLESSMLEVGKLQGEQGSTIQSIKGQLDSLLEMHKALLTKFCEGRISTQQTMVVAHVDAVVPAQAKSGPLACSLDGRFERVGACSNAPLPQTPNNSALCLTSTTPLTMVVMSLICVHLA